MQRRHRVQVSGFDRFPAQLAGGAEPCWISSASGSPDPVRNIQRDPRVTVTCAGWVLPGHAESIEDVAAKRALISAHPFFPALPVAPLQFLFRVLLRPLLVLFLRRWVGPRPVIVVRNAQTPSAV